MGHLTPKSPRRGVLIGELLPIKNDYDFIGGQQNSRPSSESLTRGFIYGGLLQYVVIFNA